MEHVCDQCKTHPATAIDGTGMTWCPRCWRTAADRAHERLEIAPIVLDLAFVQGLFAGQPPLFAQAFLSVVSPTTQAAWAQRLGLPLEPPP